MLFLQGAQDVLQQQGDRGGQGTESLRHLGEEGDGLQSVGGRRRGRFHCGEGSGQQEDLWERMKRRGERVGRRGVAVS